MPAAYAAASRALAILERVVHNPVWMPGNDILWTLDIPDELVELPRSLPGLTSETATQHFGAVWLTTRATPAIRVPSLVVEGESNVVLNPLHPAINGLHPEIVAKPFRYDGRLRPPSILESDADERLTIRGTKIAAREILAAYDPSTPFALLTARFPTLPPAKLHEALGLLLRPEVSRQALKHLELFPHPTIRHHVARRNRQNQKDAL